MSWSLDTDKVDVGWVNPPAGRVRRKITAMSMGKDSSDQSGKTQQIVMKLDNTYSVGFKVMSKNEIEQRIAQQGFAKVTKAVGLSGVMKPERLPQFVGKEAIFDFQPSKKNPQFINLSNAYPVTEDSEDSQEEESAEEAEEQQEEAEEEASEAKATPAWLKKKK